MTAFESMTERAILEAAEQEFMIKGYDGAKTESIAKSAGVTHAMLHYYYRTKENLFNKVFDTKLNILVESVISSFKDSNQPFLMRIQNFIESHFDFLARNPELPRFVINEIISKPERISLIYERANKIMTTSIETFQQDLNGQAKSGKINEIKITDLLLDIVSLNVFVFVSLPILRMLPFISDNGEKEFLEARKKENVQIIMDRLIKK